MLYRAQDKGGTSRLGLRRARTASTSPGGASRFFLQKLGEDVSEMLEYIPASFKVIRHVRPKDALGAASCCTRSRRLRRRAGPIDRGLAGPGLLAHVLVSKYADHLPVLSVGDLRREGV